MSADLSAAIEAAACGWFASAPFAAPWDDLDPMVKARARETVRPGVIAAAPLIEAQVRERIAQEIEENLAERPARGRDFDDGYQFASEVAASLARGVS